MSATMESPPAKTKAGFRVIIDTVAMTKCLDLAGKPVPSRTANEVIQCVLIRAADNMLQITGTNLAVAAMSNTAQVQVEHEGELCVNAEKLRAVIRAIDSDQLSLRLEGDTLHIAGGSSLFKLPTMDHKKFPPLNPEAPEKEIAFKGADLVQFIKKCLPAAADDNTRYSMAGVNIVPEKGRVRFMATESHVIVSASLEGEYTASPAILVPRDAIPSILLLAEDCESVSMWATENRIFVSSDSGCVIATKMEGQFPPVDDIIPKTTSGTASIDGISFGQFVRQFRVVSIDRAIKFSFSKKGIDASLFDEGTEGESTFPCKYDGSPMEVYMKGKFLDAVLSAMPDADVKIGLNAPNRPVLIKGKNCVGVVMTSNGH